MPGLDVRVQCIASKDQLDDLYKLIERFSDKHGLSVVVSLEGELTVRPAFIRIGMAPRSIRDLFGSGVPEWVSSKMVTRVINCLEAAGVFSTADLINRSEFEILSMRGLGDGAVEVIVTQLAKYDLQLRSFSY